MKTLRLFIISIGWIALTACGGDGSGSGGSHTGSKSDISAAKKLVTEYQDSNFFEKGYMSYNKVRENLAYAQTYASYARNYDQVPDKYYAMRHVGCIGSDGTALVSQQDKHTQMDYVIGVKSNRAVYVQKNSLNRCYIGQLNYGGTWNVGGFGNSISGSRGLIKLPTDACQQYEIEQALVRIPKEKLQYSAKNNNNNYWYISNRWEPDKNYYYEIMGNLYGQFTNHSVKGLADDDSFGTMNNGEAIFVSKALRSRGSNPSCEKDVFWGVEVDPNYPPNVQILGQNQDHNSSGNNIGLGL